ncbi:MAG: ATP-dependent DNA helicase RecG [Myxococcota bacterium]
MPCSAVQQLCNTLSPPLQFARRNNYACLHRLSGLQQLVQATLQRLTKDLPDAVVQQLRQLSHDFDALAEHDKRQRIDSMLTLLTTVATASPPPDSPSENLLSRPVSCLPNIDSSTLHALTAEGIVTLRDLLHVLPRDYARCHAVQQPHDLQPDTLCSVYGQVMHLQRTAGPKPRLQVTLQGAHGVIALIFFHFFPKDSRFQIGRHITAVGTAKRFQNFWQIVHPRVLLGDQRQPFNKIQVIYPTCAGLSSTQLYKLQQQALIMLANQSVADPIPAALQSQYGLAKLSETYIYLHRPPRQMDKQQYQELQDKKTAQHRRAAFEELLALQITLGRMANKSHEQPSKKQTAIKLPPIKQGARALYKSFFPHEPTACQLTALQEIAADMSRETPMTRLLHGDVGAGKTAVAAAACLHVTQQQLQCAVMAPTEVLAQQHAQRLKQLFDPLGIAVVLLTGQVKGKQRQQQTLQLSTGEAQVAVGTHALLSEDVQFARLGLCIIDEQHRFGVAQRGRLRQKGANGQVMPHLLVMTATPIPRSLALTLYGNMHISTLRSLPQGRQPIKTRVVRGEPTQKLADLAHKIKQQHRQAYVVYPVIDESEKLDLDGAKQGYEVLCQQLGDNSVVLLHGRMTPTQKQEAMAAFAAGCVQVLVSTTVVEVGVDVANASCMIIMHAQRFGLSQLHQLRGRVGRGTAASECILVAPSGLGQIAYERLQVLTKSSDGFHIAQADLTARGPGDFLGKRQSGAPLFRCCDLAAHADLIEPSRQLAQQILQQDPELKQQPHTPYRQTCAWQNIS